MRRTLLAAVVLFSPFASAQEARRAGDKAELGKMLFFDARLSGDATISCASCHDPKTAWSDGLPLSKGYPSTLYFRRTPSLLNAAERKSFYWDGRLDGSDLPTLVRDHVSEAHFMQADGRLVIERMRQAPEYERAFRKAFGGEPTYGRILDAVSAFVKTLRSRNVPFRRFLAGDPGAISASAKKGHEIFKGKGRCFECHSGPLLTDEKFHRVGVEENPEVFRDPLRHITFRRYFRTLGVADFENLRHDVGRYAVTKNDADRSKFRTPSLLEVSRRGPYMHNGSLKTLEEVVRFFDRKMALGLSAEEGKDLVEFLKSLGGDEIKIAPPELPKYGSRKLGEN